MYNIFCDFYLLFMILKKKMNFIVCYFINSFTSFVLFSFMGLGLWCKTPLSTIFQLYRGGKAKKYLKIIKGQQRKVLRY